MWWSLLVMLLSSYSLLLIVSYLLFFSLSLLHFSNSFCVSFSALPDDVWLSRNKRITYLFTYLLTYLLTYLPQKTRSLMSPWPQSGPIAKYIKGFNQLLTQKNSLIHFARPSPKFYSGWKKCKIWCRCSITVAFDLP